MSDTPRTDELIAKLDADHNVMISFVWRQMVNLARQLERELNTAMEVRSNAAPARVEGQTTGLPDELGNPEPSGSVAAPYEGLVERLNVIAETFLPDQSGRYGSAVAYNLMREAAQALSRDARDAARYRFIRTNDGYTLLDLDGEDLDSAIDQAMGGSDANQERTPSDG